MLEHGTSVSKRVELAILSAWIGVRRQVRQQRLIELAPGEARIELFLIHAGDSGEQSAADHLLRQVARGYLPERKQRFQPAAGQLALAVFADIAQEQIPKHDGFE